ncbi:unnamed protein product [Calypogeia fissa]
MAPQSQCRSDDGAIGGNCLMYLRMDLLFFMCHLLQLYGVLLLVLFIYPDIFAISVTQVQHLLSSIVKCLLNYT